MISKWLLRNHDSGFKQGIQWAGAFLGYLTMNVYSIPGQAGDWLPALVNVSIRMGESRATER